MARSIPVLPLESLFRNDSIRPFHERHKNGRVPNWAPHCFKSASLTPRPGNRLPKKDWKCLATSLSMVWAGGGQPTAAAPRR